MTFREQARQIMQDAKLLTYDDALDLIASRLELIYVRGERSGIEQAHQSIAQLQAAE